MMFIYFSNFMYPIDLVELRQAGLRFGHGRLAGQLFPRKNADVLEDFIRLLHGIPA